MKKHDVRRHDFDPEPTNRVRSKRQRALRWALWIALVLVVLILMYAVYIATIVVKISTNPYDLSSLSADANGRSNILILGEGDPGHAGEGLTDTMLVMSYDGVSKREADISIPRDLRVNVPGYGLSKINAANAIGGSTLAAQTVSNTLNLPINNVIQTNFTGLKEVVDAVGGIDVDVKDELKDAEYPCDDDQYKVCGLDIKAGPTHMDGALTLKYVRCRKGTCGNDFGRAARQQEVIGLVRAKALNPQLLIEPTKLAAIVSAVRHGITTDLSLWQMAQLALGLNKASHNQPIHLVLSTSPGGYLRDAPGSSDLLPLDGTYAAIQKAVATIFDPS